MQVFPKVKRAPGHNQTWKCKRLKIKNGYVGKMCSGIMYSENMCELLSYLKLTK